MKKRRVLWMSIIVIIILVLINFYPALSLTTRGMDSKETEHFVLYFEKSDLNAADDIAGTLESAYGKITKDINFKTSDKTEVYVYPDLATFHSKKYGLAGTLIGPDWYVGDNIGDKVLIVTPGQPGPQHRYNSIVSASVHEFVHTLIYQVNKDCPYWLDNGLAVYLAGIKPPDKQVQNLSLAGLDGMRTENPLKFGQVNGYQYSYIYLDFLIRKYGMERVVELVKAPEEYQRIFGKTLLQLDEECISYLNNEYLKVSGTQSPKRDGILYQNAKYGFSLTFPKEWENKYRVEDAGNTVKVFHKATWTETGQGMLFTVWVFDSKERWNSEGKELEEMIGLRKLDESGNYVFALSLPTDIQNIANDNNIRNEYRLMETSVAAIIKTFQRRN